MPVTAWIIALNPENPVALELCQTLQEQGIDAEIRQAVDGRQSMPVIQGREQLAQQRALAYRRAPLTSAEVGCYLSHYRLIQQAWDQGLSHICLFEDDVVAEDGLGDLLRCVVAQDDNKHLVRLMSLKIRKRKVVSPLSGAYQLVRPVRGALGTQGYVVNRSGMAKILNYGARIYMPIDKLYDSFFLYDLNCFSVEPHGIYELSRQSTIAKPKGNIDTRLLTTLLYNLNKLHRSIMRRWHYLRHRADYQPATRPAISLGKSARLR